MTIIPRAKDLTLTIFQEEFSLALTEMRTADPGDLTLTLKNPKLDGSSLAKRRKTKAESKTDKTNENCERVEEAGGALRVVRSEDSGVDVKEQQAASAADFGEDKEETILSNKADNGEDKKENFEGEMRKSNEERKDASSQGSVESRTSSDSGQDFS